MDGVGGINFSALNQKEIKLAQQLRAAATQNTSLGETIVKLEKKVNNQETITLDTFKKEMASVVPADKLSLALDKYQAFLQDDVLDETEFNTLVAELTKKPAPEGLPLGTGSADADYPQQGVEGDAGPVRQVQQDLQELGFFKYEGGPTGGYFQVTQQAVQSFQKANQLPETGQVDQATWDAIQKAKSNKPGEQAPAAPVADPAAPVADPAAPVADPAAPPEVYGPPVPEPTPEQQIAQYQAQLQAKVSTLAGHAVTIELTDPNMSPQDQANQLTVLNQMMDDPKNAALWAGFDKIQFNTYSQYQDSGDPTNLNGYVETEGKTLKINNPANDGLTEVEATKQIQAVAQLSLPQNQGDPKAMLEQQLSAKAGHPVTITIPDNFTPDESAAELQLIRNMLDDPKCDKLWAKFDNIEFNTNIMAWDDSNPDNLNGYVEISGNTLKINEPGFWGNEGLRKNEYTKQQRALEYLRDTGLAP